MLDALAEQEERIAARLKKLRADIGHPERPGHPLPAEEAAQRASVKYRQWQRWEKGETLPRSNNLERVAETFGFDVAEFYASDEEPELSQLDRLEEAISQLQETVDGLVELARPSTKQQADRAVQTLRAAVRARQQARQEAERTKRARGHQGPTAAAGDE